MTSRPERELYVASRVYARRQFSGGSLEKSRVKTKGTAHCDIGYNYFGYIYVNSTITANNGIITLLRVKRFRFCISRISQTRLPVDHTVHETKVRAESPSDLDTLLKVSD